MRVVVPPPGPGGSINGGSWSLVSQGGPFSDTAGWGDPSRYLTIRTGDLDSPGATALFGRAQTGLVGYSWTGSGWTALRVLRGLDDKLTTFNDANCASPECYALFHVLRIGGPTSVNRRSSGRRASAMRWSGATQAASTSRATPATSCRAAKRAGSGTPATATTRIRAPRRSVTGQGPTARRHPERRRRLPGVESSLLRDVRGGRLRSRRGG